MGGVRIDSWTLASHFKGNSLDDNGRLSTDCYWMLSCLTGEAVRRASEQGGGLLVAIPMGLPSREWSSRLVTSYGPNTVLLSGVCTKAFCRNKAVWGVYRYRSELTKPETECIYTARPDFMSLWKSPMHALRRGKLCLGTQRMVFSQPDNVAASTVLIESEYGGYHESHGLWRNDEVYSLWYALGMRTLYKLGMRAGGLYDRIPASVLEKCVAAGFNVAPGGHAWYQLLTTLCTRKYTESRNLKAMYDLWGGPPEVERVIRVKDRKDAECVKMHACGAATLNELQDPSFDLGRYEPGLTHKEFLLRNPAIVHETQQCWALMRFELCKETKTE